MMTDDGKKAKRAEYNKIWYQSNRERVLAVNRRWAQKNTERRSAANRKWYQNNKKRLAPIRMKWKEENKEAIAIAQRKWEKENYSTNIQYKLGVVLRHRLQDSLRKGPKVRIGSAVRDLGCTVAEFKYYLEKQFQPGMTWENHGLWHIDHEIPLAFFDLTNRAQFLRACHYTNLQPMWAKENLKKNKRLNSANINL